MDVDLALQLDHGEMIEGPQKLDPKRRRLIHRSPSLDRQGDGSDHRRARRPGEGSSTSVGPTGRAIVMVGGAC